MFPQNVLSESNIVGNMHFVAQKSVMMTVMMINNKIKIDKTQPNIRSEYL